MKTPPKQSANYRKRKMMATFHLPARRLILAGGFAVAVAAAPAIAIFAAPTSEPASLAQCPAGEEVDTYTTICTPFMVPNAGAPFQSANPDIPSVMGIPCTGHNSGQCIGLAEEAQAEGPQPIPQSTISSSP